MIWFTGPNCWSSISRHIEPATIGDITAGSTSRLTKTFFRGRSAWKCSASSMPSTSWIGSATAMIRKVRPSA